MRKRQITVSVDAAKEILLQTEFVESGNDRDCFRRLEDEPLIACVDARHFWVKSGDEVGTKSQR